MTTFVGRTADELAQALLMLKDQHEFEPIEMLTIEDAARTLIRNATSLGQVRQALRCKGDCR